MTGAESPPGNRFGVPPAVSMTSLDPVSWQPTGWIDDVNPTVVQGPAAGIPEWRSLGASFLKTIHHTLHNTR